MPNPRYAKRIEAEMRQHDWIWFSLSGKLPGLFLSPKPIIKLKPEDDGCFYISFENQNAKSVAEVINRVRGIANNTLNWDFAKQYQSENKSLGERIYNSIDLKPGIRGFSIDLKKLFGKG